MRLARFLAPAFTAAVAALLPIPARADEPAQAELPSSAAVVSPASAEEIPALVRQLDATDSEIRQRASVKLAATGRGAVPALKEAARGGPLETRVRAVQVLREIYVRGDEDSIDQAEEALDELVSERNASVSGRAEQVLVTHSDIREKRAVAEIQRLGGIVTFNDDAFADPNGVARETRMIKHVILGKDWAGGNDGLRHIRRLTSQPRMMVYYIPDSGVTEEALKDLAAAVPNLEVQRRGRACLGVSGMNDLNGRGCYVGGVLEGSAAAKAKFQVNDVIVSFDGKPVSDFKALIDLIGTTKPGDKIKVDVVRDFQKLTLEPVMDEWKQ